MPDAPPLTPNRQPHAPTSEDDFVRAVQRKVTFDVQSANAPIEARKTAGIVEF